MPQSKASERLQKNLSALRQVNPELAKRLLLPVVDDHVSVNGKAILTTAFLSQSKQENLRSSQRLAVDILLRAVDRLQLDRVSRIPAPRVGIARLQAGRERCEPQM